MTTRQLAGPPALAPLYARTLLASARHALPGRGPRSAGSGGGSGDATAEAAELVLADQPIDRARLHAYQRLTGFRVSDRLPPTYLHLLAFGPSMRLMTEPGFPFPLLGLVQLRNEIIQRRPVLAEETVTVTVRTGPLSDHPSGTVVAILSEAAVAGEPVWRETTSYLHREQGGGSSKRPPSGDQPSTELPDGPVRQLAVPADIGRRYAAVSGDRNPIHLSRLSARAFGFNRAIAHGMWLAARTLAGYEERLPEACAIDIAFKTPAFLPCTVLLRSAPLATQGLQPPRDGLRLLVSGARSGKPHLAGTVTELHPARQ